MKILVTGAYHKNHEKTRNLIQGLKLLGVKVIELPYKSLKVQLAKKISLLSQNVDAVFLPGFTHSNVKQIKKISFAPVLFDPEISNFLTKVYDEKQVIPYTPRAVKHYYKDYKAFKYADLVFTETKQYKRYFMQKMGVKARKISVVPFGIDSAIYHPLNDLLPDEFFRVMTIIENAPLDSILMILEAADSLKGQNIRFDLTGINNEQTKIIRYITDNKIRNVNLINYENEKELNILINYSSVCIGIFGNSKKSNLGIPKELFKYAACRKPIISKNSLALKEVFTPGRDILAVENSAERIASMIGEIKNDPEMGQMVGHMAMKKVERDHHFRHSAAMLLKAMKKLK